MMDQRNVDKNWTLFLDRDGVINYEKEADYIYNKDEFVMYEGVVEAMQIFTRTFGRIILVTNQRGIGKGLMTEEDLHGIHRHMNEVFNEAGAKVDAIYFCTSLDNDHPDRKPQPGMGYRAKNDFPAIDFSKSVMVGNSLSDMEFGRNLGMYTVYIRTIVPGLTLPHPEVDDAYNDLLNFARTLPSLRKP